MNKRLLWLIPAAVLVIALVVVLLLTGGNDLPDADTTDTSQTTDGMAEDTSAADTTAGTTAATGGTTVPSGTDSSQSAQGSQSDTTFPFTASEGVEDWGDRGDREQQNSTTPTTGQQTGNAQQGDSTTPTTGQQGSTTPDTGNQNTTPESTETLPSDTEPGSLTYEEYLALSVEDRQVYDLSFGMDEEGRKAFFAWRDAAKAEYDKTHQGITGDGSIDIGDYINPTNGN